MFSDELILIFSGISEQIADQRRLVQIAKQIDPRLPNSMVADHRILTSYFRNNHRLYDWMNAVLKIFPLPIFPEYAIFFINWKKSIFSTIIILVVWNASTNQKLEKPTGVYYLKGIRLMWHFLGLNWKTQNKNRE